MVGWLVFTLRTAVTIHRRRPVTRSTFRALKTRGTAKIIPAVSAESAKTSRMMATLVPPSAEVGNGMPRGMDADD